MECLAFRREMHASLKGWSRPRISPWSSSMAIIIRHLKKRPFRVYVVLLHTGSTSPKKLEDFAWIGLKPRKTPWKRVKTHALAAGRPYVWTLSPELKRLPNEKLLTENVTSKFCQNDRFLPPKWPVFALRIGNIMRVVKVHVYDCTVSCDCF